MAKRSRGTARPGQLRPTRRTQRPTGPGSAPTRPAAGSSDASLTELSGAQVDIVVPTEPRTAGRDHGPAEAAAPVRGRSTQPSSLLAARAAAEYDYVVRDVKRISVVGGSLLGVLAVVFVLVEIAHVVTI